MSATKHTPGPWDSYVACGPMKQIQVVTVPCAGPYVEQWKADCRLIAAAPELLDALKMAHQYLFTADGPDEVDQTELATAVEKAIAKATGEQA